MAASKASSGMTLRQMAGGNLPRVSPRPLWIFWGMGGEGAYWEEQGFCRADACSCCAGLSNHTLSEQFSEIRLSAYLITNFEEVGPSK